MANIRTGDKAALVIIDTQVEVVAQAHQRDAVVGNIVDLDVAFMSYTLFAGLVAFSVVAGLTPAPNNLLALASGGLLFW